MYVRRKDSAAEMDTGLIYKREEQEQNAEEPSYILLEEDKNAEIPIEIRESIDIYV